MNDAAKTRPRDCSFALIDSCEFHSRPGRISLALSSLCVTLGSAHI